MKKLLVTCLLALAVFLFSFVEKDEINAPVKAACIETLKSLSEKAANMAEMPLGKSDAFAMYVEFRKEFKSMEFLLAHIDREFYHKKLNGAPLPKLEKNIPELNVIQPSGLQVIDECFGDLNPESSQLLKTEFIKLSKQLSYLSTLYQHVTFTNEIVAHAVQYQLIRLYTLGVTGFDTPGTQMGIEDALATLNGFNTILEESDISLSSDWNKRLRKATKYVHANLDFELFDRAEFYRMYWQPMYEQWIRETNKSTIRPWQSFSYLPLEVNQESRQLFSEDFFNKIAYLDFDPKLLTPDIIDLGEQLFFDPSLSGSGEMSCATCHDPKQGFSDGKVTSTTKAEINRNSPGLVNSVYTKGFFYDLRAKGLSQQFEHVIFSEHEFNTSITEILDKLERSEYKKQFKSAFSAHQQNPVNVYTFKTSLSAYVSSLTNFDSEFDQYIRDTAQSIDESVIAGYNLFMGKAQCATCHFAPTFSGLVPPLFDDMETEVLGIPSDSLYGELDVDPGRYSPKRPKEKVSFYKNSFKTVSIRNIKNTAPYMHNGVFQDLNQVMEFYNNGGGVGHDLDLNNQTLGTDSLHLTDTETQNIIKFMESL